MQGLSKYFVLKKLRDSHVGRFRTSQFFTQIKKKICQNRAKIKDKTAFKVMTILFYCFNFLSPNFHF